MKKYVIIAYIIIFLVTAFSAFAQIQLPVPTPIYQGTLQGIVDVNGQQFGTGNSFPITTVQLPVPIPIYNGPKYGIVDVNGKQFGTGYPFPVIGSITPGGNNSFSGQNTFASVLGTSNVQAGTTYTLASTDCGKTLMFTGNSPVVTIPASIAPAAGTTCVIGILQVGATKVSVNGSAVSAASLVSPNSYTGTSGTAGSEVSLTITTVSATATAFMNGNGS